MRKKTTCPLCEKGQPYYDATYTRWDNPNERNLAGVKGYMTVDAGQCLNINMIAVNQTISAKDGQMPYPLQLSFKIKYCPLCGRRIKWLDEKLISIKDTQH